MGSDTGVEDPQPVVRPIQKVVALGLHHGLCVSKSMTLDHAKATDDSQQADSRVVESTLSVHSWGKAEFNCLGHGVNVKFAKVPRSIRFFEKKNVAQVSCGDYHSAVLVFPHGSTKGTGGTVYTFGLGTGGRLGYRIRDKEKSVTAGTGKTVREPSWCTTQPQPVGLSVNLKHCVVSLACGANHTVVTTVDGSLFTWGMGAFGVLGTGTTDNRYEPVRVEFPFEVFMTSCAAGCRHSFGLDKLGNIWAWGYGGNGRLGTGNTRSQFLPKMLETLKDHRIAQISCGDLHSACIDSLGNVYTWGSSKGGKLGHLNLEEDVQVPTMVRMLSGIRIIQVECGTGVTLALAENGNVYQWGCILGFNPSLSGSVSRTMHTPQEVTDLGSKNVFIAAGPYSCGAVDVYGDLKTWGVGSCFRLGHGSVADYQSPKFVPELRTKILCDPLLPKDKNDMKSHDSMAEILHDTGFNESRIKQVAAGMTHGSLLTCNGTVYTWGAHKGIGFSESGKETETYHEPRLMQHFSTKIKRVACGSNHTVVVTVTGMVFTWGCNSSGQLGLADLRPRAFPEHVSTLECAINVFAGYNSTCCITTTKHENFINDEVGTAWVFGSASEGKLGLGDTCTAPSIMTPRKLTYISGVYKVALGSSHSLLLQHDGVVHATGSGANGRLGTGDSGTIYSFKPVNTQLKFIDIAVGASHSLAISLEHDLYGWGKGKYINMSSEIVHEPTLIEGLPSPVGIAKVNAVIAMANHSFVITDQGRLIAWGDNSCGQLGVPLLTEDTATRELIDSPSVVLIDSPVTYVNTSRSYTVCTTAKGDAFAWGVASHGRLGIGETHERIAYKPTPVVTEHLVCNSLDSSDKVALKEELVSHKTNVESFMNELYFREKKDTVDWKTLQLLLKNEECLCRESSLKSFEDDLVSGLKEQVDFILEMEKYQRELDALRFKLKVFIKGFITRIGKANSTDVKKGPTASVHEYIRFTEELSQIVEILFLQPSYFVRLCLFGDDFDTVSRVVSSLYKRLEIPRVHNQFVSLLLTLAREDVCLFFKPETPLNASCSPFARMLRVYATSKLMSAPNAPLFYSTELQNSFINFMAQTTLVLPNTARPNSKELKDFGDFTLFLNSTLKVIVVPIYIRIVLKKMYDLIKYKIPPWWALPNVSMGDVAVYPIIPVFVYAVLQPYFRDVSVLSACHGYDVTSKEIIANFMVVSKYFDYIVNPSLKMPASASSEVNRATMTLYRNVSLMLLEYIKTILVVEETFNTEMTMETFKSHFDLEKLQVEVPGFLLAKLVNSCVETRKYLNLSAHDPLGKVIDRMLDSADGKNKKMTIFRSSLIEELERTNKTSTVKVEHRFITYEKNMSICKFSGVFLPQRLAYRQTTYSEDCVKLISLIIRYVPLAKYDPARIIHNALVELKQLDMVPGGFKELRTELDKLVDHYLNLQTPDYAMANLAKDASAQLSRMDSHETNASDLASAMLGKVLERYHQRQYLLRIYRRQGEIENCRRKFEMEFRENVEYLTVCLQHASGTYVEPLIKNAALVHYVKLHSTRQALRSPETQMESSTFSMSVLHKNGWIICKKDNDIERLPSLSLLFVFQPTSGCSITLNEKTKGSHFCTLDSCPVPSNILEAWSEDVSEGFANIFTNAVYPQGMFGISKNFVVETFSQLMAP